MIGWAILGTTALQMGLAYGQYKAQEAAAEQNIENLQERFKLRGKQRANNLREMLGAQAVAFVSQGTDPGSVTAQIIGRETIVAHQLEGAVDQLDTIMGIGNQKAQTTSAMVSMISTMAGSAGNYLMYKSNTNLKEA